MDRRAVWCGIMPLASQNFSLEPRSILARRIGTRDPYSTFGIITYSTFRIIGDYYQYSTFRSIRDYRVHPRRGCTSRGGRRSLPTSSSFLYSLPTPVRRLDVLVDRRLASSTHCSSCCCFVSNTSPSAPHAFASQWSKFDFSCPNLSPRCLRLSCTPDL